MIPLFLLLAALPTARTEDICKCQVENSVAKCSDRALEDVPKCLPRDITLLNLQDNAILRITAESFKLYPSLTQLQLGGNNVSDENVDTDVFKFIGKLKLLSIENNRIRSIDRGLLNHSSDLEELQASNNEIEVLDKNTFYSNKLLQELYLDHNLIKELPSEIFNYLTNLKVLNLNNNRISQLHENLFTHNVNLTQLFMSHNHIGVLPATIFYALPNLKMFRIAHNKLSVFQEQTISRNPNLITVDISNNDLQTLNHNTFINNTVVKYLVVENNPWVCNCSLATIFEKHNSKNMSPCSVVRECGENHSACTYEFLCHNGVIIVSWQMSMLLATERWQSFIVLLIVLFCCLYAAILIFIYGGCFDNCRSKHWHENRRVCLDREFMPPSPILFLENSSVSQYVPRDTFEEGPLLQENLELSPTTNGELQLQPLRRNWQTRPLLRS